MNDSRGFTLIEVMVSVGIIVLISAMVFFNVPKFNQDIIVNRAARELSFAFRDAEARAVQVAQRACGGAICFPQNYGVYINIAANNTQYVIFNDINPENQLYDANGSCGGSTDECVEIHQLPNGVHIKSLKSPNPANPNPNLLAFLFYRPDPTIRVYDAAPSFYQGNPYKLVVASRDESFQKTVHVWLTGQIAIK